MKQKYLELSIEKWDDLEHHFKSLMSYKITNVADLERWIQQRSYLQAVVDEELAWRYIKMTCDISNETKVSKYEKFVSEISPEISKAENQLDKKLVDSVFFDSLPDYYKNLKRSAKNSIDLYRLKNVPIIAELETLEQKYGRITGSMTVLIDEKELTLQQAGNFLKDNDRDVRKKVYEQISARRLSAVNELNELMSSLINSRHKLALNAGFDNYRDYAHELRERFDYSIPDVLTFDEVIKEEVMPIIEIITNNRKQKLQHNKLKPWDLDVDVYGASILKPFENISELVEKTIACFADIRPQYGEYLNQMQQLGHLDLASRKGKAPGGYNYPLMQTNIPFIFMNATNNVRDVETLVHEGGHAIHAFKAGHLKLTEYKETPAEIAELASMSMELISMEHWHTFFDDPEELRRAKIHQLENVISVLPWVATIDKFQHWLYTNPAHSAIDRTLAWGNILAEYTSKTIDYSENQWYFLNLWQKQLHIFEVPFYYIEYAIAQLGAIAMWRNYLNNPEKTLDKYDKALSLGYSKTLPELYLAAGIKFDFSREYVGELMSFVHKQLSDLYQHK